MEKAYEVIVGTVLLLIGILGFLYRTGFGDIPTYLLVANIGFGLWGLFVGFTRDRNPRDPGSTEI